jgi:hypothetical protein
MSCLIWEISVVVDFDEAVMSNPAGESREGVLRLDFDRRLMLQFRGSRASQGSEGARLCEAIAVEDQAMSGRPSRKGRPRQADPVAVRSNLSTESKT